MLRNPVNCTYTEALETAPYTANKNIQRRPLRNLNHRQEGAGSAWKDFDCCFFKHLTSRTRRVRAGAWAVRLRKPSKTTSFIFVMLIKKNDRLQPGQRSRVFLPVEQPVAEESKPSSSTGTLSAAKPSSMDLAPPKCRQTRVTRGYLVAFLYG